jgi:predicted acyltransferase
MKSQDSSGGRLTSIDALRGFDMFWIIGGDQLARQVCRRMESASSSDGVFGWLAKVIASLEPQFEHVAWHGFRFYDLIFPLFLFLVGCVLPFSLGKYGEGRSPGAYARVIRRTLALIALGFIYSGFLQFSFMTVDASGVHFDWSKTRFPGVLQRIGLCYFFAALVVMNFRPPIQAVVVASILAGYHFLFAFVPGSGSAGDFSPEGNLAGWLDRKLLGGTRLYYGHGDNEGILSTLPAIATTVIGALAGAWLRSGVTPILKALMLAAVGVAAIEAGWLWERIGGFPVNKILWTSSFVLVAGGWSLVLLSAFYFVIDVCGLKLWAYFFTVIGANAITIYMLKNIIDFKHSARYFLGGLMNISRPEDRDLILIVGVLALQWLVLWFFYRHRVFFRV